MRARMPIIGRWRRYVHVQVTGELVAVRVCAGDVRWRL